MRSLTGNNYFQEIHMEETFSTFPKLTHTKEGERDKMVHSNFRVKAFTQTQHFPFNVLIKFSSSTEC